MKPFSRACGRYGLLISSYRFPYPGAEWFLMPTLSITNAYFSISLKIYFLRFVLLLYRHKKGYENGSIH